MRFSFTQPFISDFVSNVNAAFRYNATIAKGSPAVAAFGGIVQQSISGSFSFLSTSAITVTGPNFVTHTYAAGSNLLSGTFTDATLFGGGSSAATSSSTTGGSVVTFTSDFLDFSDTVDRDRGLTLTAITPSLAASTGNNKALKTFRATAGGSSRRIPAAHQRPCYRPGAGDVDADDRRVRSCRRLVPPPHAYGRRLRT